MSIKQPDIIKHSNQKYPIVDSNDVLGNKIVTTYNELYLLSIEKLRNGSTIYVNDEQKFYTLIDINNYSNINGWTLSTNILFVNTLPITGTKSIIYVNNNKSYTWDGSNYNTLSDNSLIDNWKETVQNIRDISGYFDGEDVGCYTNKVLYSFDILSMSVDDSSNVLKPSDILITNPGRWIKKIDFSLYQLASEKGQPNGLATLDSTGIIPITQIPAAALERLTIVADQVSRFALTTSIVQNGDTVKQVDTGEMYYIIDDTNLNNANGYSVYTAGTASSVPWSGITGIPDSSSTLKGITKLSVEPVSSTNPIAVGDNDTRIVNAEQVTNKATTWTTINNTLYPSLKIVDDRFNTISLGQSVTVGINGQYESISTAVLNGKTNLIIISDISESSNIDFAINTQYTITGANKYTVNLYNNYFNLGTGINLYIHIINLQISHGQNLFSGTTKASIYLYNSSIIASGSNSTFVSNSKLLFIEKCHIYLSNNLYNMVSIDSESIIRDCTIEADTSGYSRLAGNIISENNIYKGDFYSHIFTHSNNKGVRFLDFATSSSTFSNNSVKFLDCSSVDSIIANSLYINIATSTIDVNISNSRFRGFSVFNQVSTYYTNFTNCVFVETTTIQSNNKASFTNCIFLGILTINSSNTNFNNCRFLNGVTVVGDYNKILNSFIGVTASGTKTITISATADKTTIIGCTAEANISNLGTNSEMGFNTIL